MKTYDIPEAADKLCFSVSYIRTLIRRGSLKTTKVPLSEGSLVTKHVIDEYELNRFAKEAPHKSRRRDGRNKFTMYARPDEIDRALEALEEAGLHELCGLIEPANSLAYWPARLEVHNADKET